MKILDNYLDKYYARKAVELLIQTTAILHHNTKVVKAKDRYEIYVKKRNQNEKQYKPFYDIKFSESIEKYLMIYNCTNELINKLEHVLNDKEVHND